MKLEILTADAEIRNPKSEIRMKMENRNRRSKTHLWGNWLLFLLLCSHLIFSHGCHGADVDDELCVLPPAARKAETRKPKPERKSKQEAQNLKQNRAIF